MMPEDQTTLLKYESYEFNPRYYIHTAKNNVTSFAHVIAEAVSNSDESITRRAHQAGENESGRIVISYDPDSLVLTITDDGDGMTADVIRRRLKRIGAEAAPDAKRGFFHRGIREVFIAMGAGTVDTIGLKEGDFVYSQAVFHPTDGVAVPVCDAEVTDELRRGLGIAATGTRVTIPMKRLALPKPKHFTFPSLESQVENCVQVRPVLADPNREVILEYGAAPPRRMRFSYPIGTTLVAETEAEIAGFKGVLWASAAGTAIKGGGLSKQTRRYGILIRGERAAYEVSLGTALSSYPTAQQLFGELRIDGIELAQREADAKASEDSELIYKADRSGLNADHPLVEQIYDFIDEKLGPLLAALEAREKNKTVTADVRRQLTQLARIINDAVDHADFGDLETPGGKPSTDIVKRQPDTSPPKHPTEIGPPEVPDGIAFAYDRIFVAAGKARTVDVWLDTEKIPVGTSVSMVSAPGDIIRTAALSASVVPKAPPHGVAQLSLTVQAGDTEGRHEVLVSAGTYSAALPVHVRFPRASGFISQIDPVDKDWESGSALYDPATGRVTVYVGRPEFVAAAKRARSDKVDDPFNYPLYRQLVVESVREAALRTAAERRAEVTWDELPYQERLERDAFSKLVIFEYQALDYKLRHLLLSAFVDT